MELRLPLVKVQGVNFARDPLLVPQDGPAAVPDVRGCVLVFGGAAASLGVLLCAVRTCAVRIAALARHLSTPFSHLGVETGGDARVAQRRCCSKKLPKAALEA